MNVTTLERDLNDKLPSAAWPGGYPIVYYTLSGDLLCPTCATEELDTWIDADARTIDGPLDYDGPQYSDILWEGIEWCVNCNTAIRGAYEPDEE